jgi:FOG: CBS domain
MKDKPNTRPVDLLRLRLVSEVMTREVICAAPDSSLLAIAQLMAEHRVSSVMIVQPAKILTPTLQIPVGIVTERDIVQFQAQPPQRRVFSDSFPRTAHAFKCDSGLVAGAAQSPVHGSDFSPRLRSDRSSGKSTDAASGRFAGCFAGDSR